MKVYMICSMIGGFPIKPVAYTTIQLATLDPEYNMDKHNIREITVIHEESGK